MNRKRLMCVIPECYVDTNVVSTLLEAAVNHQHSCTKVVGVIQNTFSNKFAVGIIDNDKHKMGYATKCDEIAHTQHLTLKKEPNQSHFLILVSPAIDKFLLDCASEQNVDPAQFSLPSELKAFTKESKAVTSNTDPRFTKLVKAIAANKEITALKNALTHLCDNTFQASIPTLQAIFR